MRRQYNPPPTYGGSRFIRATHGVRGLEDNELAGLGSPALPARPDKMQRDMSRNARRSTPGEGELLPDFEYFGNILGSADKERQDIIVRPGSGENDEASRRADEEYRGTPAPVDRIGHDYDEDASDFRVAGDAAGEADRWRGEADGGDSQMCGDGACEDAPEISGDGRHTRRPMRKRGMFRPDRPIGGHRPDSAPSDAACGADASPEAQGCTVVTPEQKHPFFNLSVEDGDLLLLVLLALLAGEEGCADLVATLALLLMIR